MKGSFLRKDIPVEKRSAVKALTYRVLSVSLTFVTSLIITGKLSWASAIVGAEIVTKVLLYYFHERLWAKSSWGKVKNIKI